MFLKSYALFFLTFIIFTFSVNLFAQHSAVTFDYSIQPDAAEKSYIGAIKWGEYNWGNCGAKFARDLRIYETTNFSSNPFAIFSGGAKVGSYWKDEYGGGTCNGLYGYATTSRWFQAINTQMTNTITITFAPKKVRSVNIISKPNESYLISINNSSPQTYTSDNGGEPSRFQSNDANLLDIGFTQSQLGSVTTITIQSVNSQEWAFATDGVGLNGPANGSGGSGENPPPVPNVVNPVVFVPGVSGSEIVKTNEGIKWLPLSLVNFNNDLEELKNPNSNNSFFASDVFRGQRTQFSGLHTDNSYGFLLNYLKANLVKEYIAYHPRERTFEGCDMTQNSNDEFQKPMLFVFPYDWRRNNVETANQLRQFISCVNRFHPNKKVRIVTHSMGSLVARRYALDYPNDNKVDKIITIGGPWLGAPKAIYSLETGSFIASAFGSSPISCIGNGGCGEWAINMQFASGLRDAMQTFPGPLQLLPSWYYYQLNQADNNTSYFAFRNFPWSNYTNYNYSDTKNWINSRHINQPGTIAHIFHVDSYLGLQDNWRQDSNSIKFYHIYGQQSANLTVGKVEYTWETACSASPVNLSLNCVADEYFEPRPTNGDGTVPLLSARRISTQDNFNSPNVKRYIEDAINNPLDEFGRKPNDNTEHTKMTENTRIQKRILKILLNEDNYDVSDATPLDNDNPILPNRANTKNSPRAEDSSFYVSLHNVTGFHLETGPSSPDLTNKAGKSSSNFMSEAGPNGSQAIPIGEKAVWLAMPALGGYKVNFYGDGTPIKVQIIKGLDYDRVEKLVQYIDVNIPAGKVAELYLSQYSCCPNLSYDSDDDGSFDTYIEPTLFIEDENAKDLEPPVVSFDYQEQAGGKLLTLSATDNLSGVRKIYYSYNGQQFSEYATPLLVNSNQIVYVFAEDNNFNRTGIAPIDIIGNSYSIGNRVWFDLNNDGKINKNDVPEEVGINGVSVSLFADSDGNGQPDNATSLKTTTTSNGYYRFDGLSAGNYVVRINPENFADNGVLVGCLNTSIQTSDDTDSDATQAGENGSASNDRNSLRTLGVLSNSITLGPNLSEPVNETDVSNLDASDLDKYSDLTVDFGFYRLNLSGTVWNDSGISANSNNGILNNGESVLPNYRVKLFKSGQEIPVGNDGILGTSDDANGGILTDVNGEYKFQGLEEGSYVVKVTRLGANSSSYSSSNPEDNVDFDNNGSIDLADNSQIASLPILLSPANKGLLENTRINEFLGLTENQTIDFGLVFVPTAANASVNGKVLNQLGRGISRATVIIQSTNGNFSKTEITNNFGNFSFGDIPSGNTYVIAVTRKGYSFNSQTISVNEDLQGLVFSAN